MAPTNYGSTHHGYTDGLTSSLTKAHHCSCVLMPSVATT